jgi:hypothetical protein
MSDAPGSSNGGRPRYPGPVLPYGWLPPDPEEILAMSISERAKTLNLLDMYDSRHGTRHLADYEYVKARCPFVDEDGVRCKSRKHLDLSACLKHVPIDELDPKGASRRRRAAAKLRLEELLDDAVTKLEDIIRADAELVAPSIRLQAIQMLFDRAGVPKEQSIAVDANVAIFDAGSATELIKQRMANLRESVIAEELLGIERASREIEPPDVISGDVVEDDS